MSRLRSRIYDRSQRVPGSESKPCDHPGCRETGEFRAPRSRDTLNQYYWFCLDHVRVYNAAWDYYRGMSPDQIEVHRRQDIVGGRPSWPLGTKGPKHYDLNHEELRDALRRFFVYDDAPVPKRPPTPEEEALAVLELDLNATHAEIKARYKKLVKQHHPDANGGDKAAEDKLKSINQAYSFLKVRRNQTLKQEPAY
jgi:hypothetical protein